MYKEVSVSTLVRYLKEKNDSDDNLYNLTVTGEISNVRTSGSKHLYFDLKDDKAKIRAVMFTKYLSSLNFKPKDGDQVLVTGNVQVYNVDATFNIQVKEIENIGLGKLYLEFEKNKKLLQEKGYFAQEHKKLIPKFPKKIAIITAKESDALKDVIYTINHRYKLVRIVALETIIQGDKAPKQIIEAINLINTRDYDVIIIARGGGSYEDLSTFNNLEIVEAIYNSSIPIITGIGHENDFTLADYVSDCRASTPTKAAIVATPDTNELLAKIKNQFEYLENFLTYKINNNYQQLDYLYDSLQQTFNNKLKNNMLYLNKLQHELNKNDIKQLLNNHRKNIMQQTLIMENSFNNILKHKKQLVLDNYNKLNNIFEKYLSSQKQKINELIIQLNLLDPNNITDKGYAIVYVDGKVVKKQTDININDLIEVKSKQYKFKAKVVEVKDNE